MKIVSLAVFLLYFFINCQGQSLLNDFSKLGDKLIWYSGDSFPLSDHMDFTVEDGGWPTYKQNLEAFWALKYGGKIESPLNEIIKVENDYSGKFVDFMKRYQIFEKGVRLPSEDFGEHPNLWRNKDIESKNVTIRKGSYTILTLMKTFADSIGCRFIELHVLPLEYEVGELRNPEEDISNVKNWTKEIRKKAVMRIRFWKERPA